uniref:Uncharacterized protein n=1 Tax=Clytia hemisphaerica TaxID=252671 RepID=A0A7M5UHC3_9CNID
DQECHYESDKQGNLGFFDGRQDHPYCQIPPGEKEHRGGHGIQKEGLQRMEIKTIPIQKTESGEGHPGHRSVCIQSVEPGSSLFFLENGSFQPGAGCLPTGLEKCQRLCLSPLLPNRKGAKENSIRPNHGSSDNTSLAGASLVSNSTSIVSNESNSFTYGRRPSEASRKGSSSSLEQVPQADCMDVVREQLASKGVSEKSSDLIVNSRRSGTHYKSAWGK